MRWNGIRMNANEKWLMKHGWHTWYAWRPVIVSVNEQTKRNTWAWLEYVERIGTYDIFNPLFRWSYMYKVK